MRILNHSRLFPFDTVDLMKLCNQLFVFVVEVLCEFRDGSDKTEKTSMEDVRK